MDLFDYMRSNSMEKEAPLASRMRPRTLDEVVGQQHIIGRDKLLYRAIKADKLSSIFFLRPSGNRKNYPGQGDRKHYQRHFYTDQCHSGGQEGYGGSGEAG